MTKYSYKAFGLIIESEMPFIELEEGFGTTDVYIRYGQAPKHLEGSKSKHQKYEYAEGTLLWFVEEVGRIYIKGDFEIICDLNEGVDHNMVRSYILGLAFAYILMLRGVLPLHGCGFVYKDEGILFLGQSGAGKSTMSHYLKSLGHLLLSDDLIPIHYDQEQFKVSSAYPAQRIRGSFAKKIGLDTKSLTPIYTSSKAKKYILHMGEAFYKGQVPLKMIFEVVIDKTSDHVTFEEVTGMEKIRILNDNILGRRLINESGNHHKYFPVITSLAQKIPYIRIKRPDKQMTVDVQYDIMISCINKFSD